MPFAAVVDEEEGGEHAHVSGPELEKAFVKICMLPLLTRLPLYFGVLKRALDEGASGRADDAAGNHAVLNTRSAWDGLG